VKPRTKQSTNKRCGSACKNKYILRKKRQCNAKSCQDDLLSNKALRRRVKQPPKWDADTVSQKQYLTLVDATLMGYCEFPEMTVTERKF
jgi:hypothetical protein